MKSYHGVLAINKPPNMTSFDVCHYIKRLTKSKVGHTGTLDPDATGVLIVCVGATTKYVPFLMGQSKVYQSKLVLGVHTHSLDTSGNVLETKPVTPHSYETWKDLVLGMIGVHQLPVPQVSAIKVDGERLYKQPDIDLKDLPIKAMHVYDAQLIDVSDHEITIQMHVSSGSYIRSLNVELAKRSGNLGTTSDIIRVKNGSISIEETQSIPQSLDELRFLNPKDLFSVFPYVILDDITPVLHGKIVSLDSSEPLVCVLVEDQPFAILEKVELGYRVKRGLWYEDLGD
jgi:tRNA pseudouridine55 synthase